MLKQVKIEGYEIPSAVAFRANVGDKILVVNGVCIGLLNGQATPSPKAAQLALPAPPKSTRGRHNPEADEKILAVLRKDGPLDARRILDALGLDPKDPKRKLTSQRITRLTARSVIVPIKADKHKGHPRYELVTP
jgi:hypothetical protein